MSYLAKSIVPIPLSPRTCIYFPDGYGRDSYIYSNNGGLCKSGMKIISSNESYGSHNGSRFASLV